MIELECIPLEDGLKYLVVSTIVDGNNSYVYLSEKDNSNNFCIRKVTEKDGSEYIVPLDSEEEFNKALNLFKEKNC